MGVRGSLQLASTHPSARQHKLSSPVPQCLSIFGECLGIGFLGRSQCFSTTFSPLRLMYAHHHTCAHSAYVQSNDALLPAWVCGCRPSRPCRSDDDCGHGFSGPLCLLSQSQLFPLKGCNGKLRVGVVEGGRGWGGRRGLEMVVKRRSAVLPDG